MEQFFDADIILFQKFFYRFVEQVAAETLGCDRERFIARTKRQSGVTNIAKDCCSEIAEFIVGAEDFCNGERMKVFEQRTRESVVRANGRRRREQDGEEMREPIVFSLRIEVLVNSAKQKSRGDREA